MTTATLDTLHAWLRSRYSGQIEQDDGQLRISDRESAGDDEPPAYLLQEMDRLGREATAAFSNVSAEVQTIDEWADLTLTVKA